MTARVLRTHLKEHGAVSTLKKNIKDLIQTIADQFEISNSLEIAQSIKDSVARYGIDQEIPDYFTINNINNMLLATKFDVQQIDPSETSTDIITEVPQARAKYEASREFIDKSFGLAKEVAIWFENITNQNLFDCLFINRGSIKQKIGVVQNTKELNDNIRNYQTQLLKNITTYLRHVIRNAPNLKITDDLKQALKQPIMYDGNNKYTDILEVLQPLIDTYIKRPLMGNTDAIREIYNTSRNSDNPDYKLARLRLNAFNSIVLLDNFDTYMSVLLGKAIQIKDFNLKTGEDKYQISEKAAQVATTWRTSENIFVEKEADAITRLAINTSPLYNWNSDVPKEGYFLNFSDFQHIIAKIKDLVYNPMTEQVIFDSTFKERYPNLYNQLPEEIKGRSLKAFINRIRRNPKKYLNNIFDILANNDFKQDYTNIYKQFTGDELNKLYSLSKGIFNGNNSLRLLSSSKSAIDFYSFITESADSIFNVKYIQYFKDENGKVQVRTLLDSGITNIKRKIEQSINVQNSIKLINDWDAYKKSLNIEISRKDDIIKSISYIIPGTDTQVTVFANSGDVQISRDINYAQDLPKLIPFIDEVLRLNLENNIDFFNSLKETFDNSYYELGSNLLNFVSRIILNKCVSKEVISTSSDKQYSLDQIYGRNMPDYNYDLDELGMIHQNDVRTLFKIALAKANLDGITTSTQVKDGEGNGQSNQTLSRLLGSLYSQWELQEKKENSITNQFLLLTNPDILEGIYTAKEFYDPSDKSKQTTKMNVNEMTYSQIVYDFIGGLITRDDNNVVGNGHVLILPSVNSDKGTIGRLKTNLNPTVNIKGVQKQLKDCTPAELEELIAQEFGLFYEKMYTKITNDWKFLEDYIASNGYPQIKGLLASDFINGFQNFNETFESLFTGFDNPVEFIKAFTLAYNKSHRLHPLELVDQVHYKVTKNKQNKPQLSINKAIIAQIARFKPESYIFQGNTKLLEYPTSRQFWDSKKADILKGLLKSDFKINVTQADIKSDNGKNKYPELRYIKDNYKDWINTSGDVVLARVIIDNKVVDITSNVDFLKLGLYGSASDNVDRLSESIQLNPIFEQYNYLDYLISQEFMCLTVGSFVAHPEKSKSSNVLEQEAAHFQAQHKRNVSFTAAMHEFQLNTLDGIPEYYNLAVIEDIHDYQGTITGLTSDIKPFDGATFVNPFVVILENNSLGGHKAGISKKQFVHFKNESTGTGGIIKTAGFGLTNDWIRNSPFLEKMMEKMTDNVWINKPENDTDPDTPFKTDITRDWNGNKIKYKKFFFKENGKFYQVTDIKSLGNNTYQRTIQEVTIDGNPIFDENGNLKVVQEEPVIINSNFKLWNFFGGKNSMELRNNKLTLSNTSVENVVIAMNNIGAIINDNIQTQDDIWQALKMSDVHYLATAGAVKQGAANINSVNKYNDNEKYDTQRIHMYQAGIQLDKEHHADEAELSLMTQVISACAAKGYTIDTAIDLYNALRQSTDIKNKDHLQAVKKLFSDGSEESINNFQEVLMKSIVKALATSNGDNFAKTVALDLMNQAKEGKKISYANANIPLSDNNIYRKVFSTIASYLTKTGIKQKIPGVLSVLTPSHEIEKLYAGRKYESFDNPTKELEAIQAQQVPIFNINDPISNITNIELGRTYLVTYTVENPDTGEFEDLPLEHTEPVLIRTSRDYKQLRKDVEQGKVTQVVEDIKSGRNLSGYNIRFKTDKGSFQIWDLDSTSGLDDLIVLKDKWKNSEENILELKEILEGIYKVPFNITLDNALTYIEITQKRLRRQLQNDLCNLSKTTPDPLEQYAQLLNNRQDSQEWYRKYTQWVNIKLGRSDGNKLVLKGVDTQVDSSNFDYVNQQVLNLLRKSKQVRINGEWHTIDKNSLQEQAYEIIMPKTFSTKFGLSEFDDLYTIEHDVDYFVKQYLKNKATKVNPNQYSIEFKRSNGDHIYVLSKNKVRNSELIKLTGVVTQTDDDGKIYRLDSNNNIMYEITPDTEIYIDSIGNQVIVSDNIEHYVNNLTYDSVKVSDAFQSELSDICNILKNSNNRIANDFGKYITSLGNRPQDILKLNEEFHAITLDNYTEFPITNEIIKAGREKHTSFLRSLDIVAARIPAQSMQSYMPMRVVAFDNPDINTAYVSTYQILLQGSDF